MCDPSITFEQLNDPSLFDKLRPDSNITVGEILYLGIGGGVLCEEVTQARPSSAFIKLRTLYSNHWPKLGERAYNRGLFGTGILLFRRIPIFENRKEFLSVLEGTDPTDSSDIERYLRSEDSMREISQFLGGKKRTKRTKRTKRANKTNKINRKKRTKRRR
jgi:hypothetical protein